MAKCHKHETQMKNKKYIKLGALVICCIAILVWGINYLKGIDIFKKSTTYYARYERVEGLVKSSAILINGYQVGSIQDVSFSNANDGSFLVKLAIEGDIKIPKGSKSILTSSDLLGTKAIKLALYQNSEYYSEGDTLPSSIESGMIELLGSEVIPIKNKAENLISSLDSTVYALNNILDVETQQNLKLSIAHFNSTMQNMADISAQLNLILTAQSKGLNNIISNIDTISTALALSSNDINRISANLSTMSDSLASSNLKSTIDNLSTILAKIESGEGSLGALVNDKNLYLNLNEASESLNHLLVDFQNNPSKYVKLTGVDFGKDIYISSADIERNENYTFRVCLLDSSAQIDLDSPLFKHLNVEEIYDKGIYSYVTPMQHDFSAASKLLLEVQKSFSAAELIAYKNGKEIKLSKATKKLSN